MGPNSLRISAWTRQTPPLAHAHEFWGIRPHAARLVPPGVIPTNETMEVAVPSKGVGAGATLAIGMEPPGGSPTGLPAGPVVYSGVPRAI